jgi:L-threonylcarbamoyladenylate synthase
MKKDTTLLSIDHPRALGNAVEVIESGGVIAFPTDTVYGIGVSAFNEYAVEKIYRVKGRSILKAIPVLIADPEDLKQITSQPNPTASKLIQEFWPGALTLVLKLGPDLPINLSPSNTIGIRLPDHDLTRELLRATGPLATTSANHSGQPSALTASEVLAQLGGKIDLILDGGPAPGGQASTVLDCSGAQPRILREGPISWETIRSLLDG